MSLPLFTLLSSDYALPASSELVCEGPHEKAAEAYDRQFHIPEGCIILTTWRGELHRVTYQTPLEDDAAIQRRNAKLFDHYGEGKSWKEILDNGFGKTFRRSDMQRFALWSYVMDFNTFGTMEFHEIMWG